MGYADYTRGTGTTGTMLVRVADAAGQNGVITANHIQFWINAGQSQTNVGNLPWSGFVNGVNVGGGVQYPSGNPWVLVAEYYVGSTQNVRFSIGASGTQGLGGPTDFWVTVNRATVPPAPTMRQPDQITPTGMRVQFDSNGNGGSEITSWGLQRATDAAFTQNVILVGSSGTTIFNDMVPGTTYYFRARGQNALGVSGWSAPVSATTTNPGAPTLTSVTPDATGSKSTVVMTGPSGYTVGSYVIQNRTPGGSWSTVASGSANPQQEVSGLTPGQTYEWRVAAVTSGYQTAYSNVITRTQPQPNASPGAFWNGDTPDTPTTNYGWTGTAGASTSTAQTLTGGAVGWLKGAAAVAKGSGGTAVQYQVPGGLEPNGNGGNWSALYVMLTAATGNGFRGGTDGVDGYATVTEGGQYMGSIFVRPNRARVLAAMWVWYNAGGVEIGTTRGASVSVGANAVARLQVLGTAPVGAVRGAVVFTDPPGSSMMAAGDSIQADADMASTGILYPYFDGNTPDTAQFIYSWTGAANSSPSQREAIPQSEQNPLLDPNCPPLPVPPAPPSIEDDCIDPIGSWRRRLFVIDSTDIPEHLAAVPTMTLQTFGQPESQVRIRWYRNPDCLQPLAVDTSEWEYEQIISFIPANTVITLEGVSERVWAEVNGADPIPADSLLYGTNGVPATWPTLSCGGCWLVSLDTDLTANVSNLLPSASLTVRE
ncbi:minor tail protein [Microbacterium phage Smarties]|uniref:Minor tail protein n=1 Tax=Microbacterium phage Ariadne TaxID=2656546 RepID=A0A649VAS2_9CAUD|nr:minor tail protein [Microbacterium phage Ariadne]QGJ89450.1 minor tail protein [Microbacterium phage Ariadne]QGJ91437.1 minor tail protein [Microbacterium phage Smarties]